MKINTFVYAGYVWGSLLVMFSACSFSPKNKGRGEMEKVMGRVFQMPEIPSIYTDTRSQAKYLIAHYWDKFDFADTALIHLSEITEQAFVNFLQLFPYVSYPELEKGIVGMLDKALTADTLMFAHFTRLYAKYLYDPNSPMLNEEFYIPVLQYITASGRVGEQDKMRPAFRLEMALKNRQGSIATDFTYTLPSGKKEKLSGITSDYTILFFNNPDCDACRTIKSEVESSAFVHSLLHADPHGDRKKLVFLSVFPDSELEVWRKFLHVQPEEWICAYDDGQVITRERLYDLRAIPTFYLLDKDKKVVLKDVPFQAIVAYLSQRI